MSPAPFALYGRRGGRSALHSVASSPSAGVALPGHNVVVFVGPRCRPSRATCAAHPTTSDTATAPGLHPLSRWQGQLDLFRGELSADHVEQFPLVGLPLGKCRPCPPLRTRHGAVVPRSMRGSRQGPRAAWRTQKTWRPPLAGRVRVTDHMRFASTCHETTSLSPPSGLAASVWRRLRGIPRSSSPSGSWRES